MYTIFRFVENCITLVYVPDALRRIKEQRKSLLELRKYLTHFCNCLIEVHTAEVGKCLIFSTDFPVSNIREVFYVPIG